MDLPRLSLQISTRSSHQLVGPGSAVTSVAENLDGNFKCVDFPQDINTVCERSSGRKNIAEGQTVQKHCRPSA